MSLYLIMLLLFMWGLFNFLWFRRKEGSENASPIGLYGASIPNMLVAITGFLYLLYRDFF